MNVDLIKINKNVGIVTDEAGRSKTVEVHDTNLESILLKENELENAKKVLQGIQDEFADIDWDNHKVKVLCLAVLFVGIVYAIPPIILAVGGKMPWIITAKILFTIGLLVGGIETFNGIFQKKISKRNTENILKKKEDLEKKVHNLEEELKILKERSQFRELSEFTEKDLVKSNDITTKNDYENNTIYSYNPGDVKVLKLVPTKSNNRNNN